MANKPHFVDAHVGKRLRQRRQSLHYTQSRLASTVNITFQQVQKYENGSNRLSASRMWQFGRALGVEPAYFFEGLPSAFAVESKP